MSEILIGEIMLDIALLLGLTFLLGGLLERVHVPVILGALLVAMVAHSTPAGSRLLSEELHPVFTFMADFGVMLLLFFIGLQVDMEEIRSQSEDIVWLTVLNTSVPFLLGGLVTWTLGYSWLLAFIIGLTCTPTAEVVIVPILDEFDLIRTRVGNFIIGAGVLDDVIEVFLVVFVSVWIGGRTGQGSPVGTVENEVLGIVFSIGLFLLLVWLSCRLILPRLETWLSQRASNLLMLSMLVLLGLGGFSEYSGLGMVVGALIAGVVMRPVYQRLPDAGEKTTQAVRAIAYGFFGPVFFFWVGLSVDLEGMVREPVLALSIFLAATLGKLLGTMVLVPMKKATLLEGWIIGIGGNARLTTEIVVAKLLLDARLIDVHLFTALVAASSLSAILVPLLFAWMVRRWGSRLKGPVVSEQIHGAV